MESYYQDSLIAIYHGDCREILPSLKGISAVVTDCPYELGFMGKSWDSKGISFQSGTWQLIREACLPGAMLLSFGGTRTSHRIACAIEDAGWQIRDTIMWVYGSGFPKSLDISKAIDKQQGTYIRGETSPNSRNSGASPSGDYGEGVQHKTLPNPQSSEAKLWEGYGTALKPAYEPIIVAMNPIDGTFADNALKHKVAGLNIDECRIPFVNDKDKGDPNRFKGLRILPPEKGWNKNDVICNATVGLKARFPANFIHDGSQEVMELFPESKGAFAPVKKGQNGKSRGIYGDYAQKGDDGETYYGDSGSAARFFYCAKASRSERDEGLEDMPTTRIQGRDSGQDERNVPYKNRPEPQRNQHPTIKPLSLMTYLCKLVKMPEYNLILDPFCGSGTTLLACKKLGIKAIGIELNEEYCEIAKRRVSQSL